MPCKFTPKCKYHIFLFYLDQGQFYSFFPLQKSSNIQAQPSDSDMKSCLEN